MFSILLALIVGVIVGVLLDVFALWLPYCIDREEARWIAEARDDADDRVIPERFSTLLCGRNYRNPDRWVVVLLSTIVVIVCSLQFGWSLRALGLMGFACGMTTLAVIDQRVKYLPDQLTLPMMWVGLLVQLNQATKTVGIENAVLGVVFGYLILWIVAYLFLKLRGKDGVGHGDMKLMAVVGAWLGPLSIPLVLFFASMLGIAWQLVAIVRKKMHSQDQFAFGPWIVVCSLLYLFFSQQILARG
jgi:leader peptidase (prepilin peptidase) / N-methyltransferase